MTDPVRPRLGDPVAVYVSDVNHGGKPGSVDVFGYRFALLPADDGYMRAMVAVPSDIEPGDYPITLAHPNGPSVWPPAVLTVVGREFKKSELRVAKKFTKTKRSDALKERLRREHIDIQQVWTSTPTAIRDLGQPVLPTRTRLTGYYGTQRVFNGEARSVHYGVDLNGRVGEPVLASADGQVVLSAMRWGSGGTLILDHGGGLFSVYFHLSKRRVEVGANVKKGQRIGDVGRSGRVTGPHLHFGVAIRAEYTHGRRAGQARSMYVDPETFLALRLGRSPALPRASMP